MLLFIKLLFFGVMLTLALLAVTIINKRMRQQASHSREKNDGFRIKDLSNYDGKEGRPAYVLFRKVVYDLTNSPQWKGGSHFGEHAAGEDLTSALIID
jgi:predicted heme/steroid binding protein